ncbi:MAG: hypothetical protein JOS17DRAFT_126665 [Linnemannia elongata]|nr:MAG: hypothetical protein JOS17DRAFT_126665 [Linnemannia elongata]
MSDACKRFFNLPELLELLTVCLELKDVASLILTNRQMHRLCTPSLYNELRCVEGQAVGSRDFRIFETLTALHALARNIKHVRILDIGIVELAYYYNCVLAFERELQSQTTTDPLRLSGPVRLPPFFLPSADTHSCQVVPLPPMTRLLQLDITIGPARETSYTLPSVMDFRARLAQTCWLIYQNPGLVSLTLSGIPFLGSHARSLAETLARLSRLETLVLDIRCRIHYWLEICRQLFFCLPSSIRKVTMDFKENGRNWQFEHVSTGRVSNYVWYREDKAAAAAVMERRQEPLVHLEELSFRGKRGYWWVTTDDLAAMLAHCPNLKKLNAHFQIFDRAMDVEDVARLIAKACPRIEVLVYGPDKEQNQMLLPLRIMGVLPAQQVVIFELRVGPSYINEPLMNMAIQRHSTTLRELRFQKNNDFISDISVSSILNECCNLEVLHMPCTRTGGFYVTLDDTLHHPWSCAKLTHLALGISGCEVPEEPGVEPYHHRPTPIILTTDETRHLSRLEDLYRRIGSLTALEELDLVMVPLDEDGEVDYAALEHDRMSFPAMLTLPDPQTGMPGYLDLFSEIKLEVLQRSIDPQRTQKG